MKINTEKNDNKTLRITLLSLMGILIIAGGYTAYAYNSHIWPFQSDDSSLDEKNMPKANNSIKEQNAEQSKDDSKNVGSDAPTPPEASEDGGKSTVAMNITAASVEAGTLMVRTLVEYVTSDGTCTLNMTGPNGTTYTAKAEIQAGSSTSSCKGFNVPISSLTAGSWTINITFENNDITAKATKNINI